MSEIKEPEFRDDEERGNFYALNGPLNPVGNAPDTRVRPADPVLAVYESNGKSGKWSGKLPPPAIGSKVRINFNELGRGTVEGYFVEAGWFGIRVRLSREPGWRKKNSAARGKPALVFGPELELKYA